MLIRNFIHIHHRITLVLINKIITFVEIIKNSKMKMLICIFLQFVSFIPFYIIWVKDCKELGKENLSVSLEERFLTWMIICPIWFMPFLK